MAKKESKKTWFAKITGFFSSRKKTSLIVLAIIVVGIFFIWRQMTNANKRPQYQTATAQKGTLVESISASGQMLSTNIVNITTGASGVADKVFVKDGETVSQGESIAQIQLDQAGQQQYTQALASYTTAKHNLDSANATLYSLQSTMFSDWQKYTDLATNSVYTNSDGSPNTQNRLAPDFTTAQDNWLKAEADYKNQQGAISAAQASLNNASISLAQSSPTITAPIAGTIGNLELIPGMVLGSQGSSVSVGTGGSVGSSQNTQRVAVIQNNGLPIATFNVTETDIGSVKIGQKATLTLDSQSGKTFTGKVAAVDNIGTVSSGVTNYTVLVSFDTDAPGVLPNMATTASIITNVKDNVILVPSAAVQSAGGQDTVRILKNGQLQTVPVEVGGSNDTETEIISGVSEGDVVVTSVNTPATTTRSGQTSPFGGGAGGGGRVFFRGGGG